MVRVVVPVEPRAMVKLEGLAVTVNPGAATETTSGEEVLPLKLVSPE
jgi:hypothetical protein